MGRGRTTTGMCAVELLRAQPTFAHLFSLFRVAAALVSNILFGHHTLFDMNSSVNDLEGGSGGAWDGRESEPYLHGEYKLVLQLVAVLQVGPLFC